MGTGEKLPSGHVRCPNCAKMLPQAFINSHLDSCLIGGKGGGGGIWGSCGGRNSSAPATAQLNGVRSSSGGGGGHAHSTANGLGSGPLAGRAAGSGSTGRQLKVCKCDHVCKSQLQNSVRLPPSTVMCTLCGGGTALVLSCDWMPHSSVRNRGLCCKQVPPKLCVALLSDKAMRDNCKGFGLPATGRKEVRPLLHSVLGSLCLLAARTLPAEVIRLFKQAHAGHIVDNPQAAGL
jgi:hypothetical protein